MQDDNSAGCITVSIFCPKASLNRAQGTTDNFLVVTLTAITVSSVPIANFVASYSSFLNILS
jgi:hypothetical protein